MNVALHSDSLNLISICTGGGGLDLGVELAIPSARSVCLVEREAFGVSQLVSAMQQGLLAQAPVWSDARTFDGRAWRGAVDGLIGGIPCQPHSLAGKRLEREDPRDLWSTARRIIVQSGAWFVLIENVEGMLSSGGAERVYGDLGRLGFAREVGLFTASEVGTSHQRGRTFILAVADTRRGELRGRPRPGSVLCAPRTGEGEGDQRERDGDAAGGCSSGVLADPSDTRLQGRERGGPSGEGHRATSLGSAAELRPALVEHAGSSGRGSRRGHGEAGQRPSELEPANPDFPMVDAQGNGRGEGQTQPSLRRGWDSPASADSSVADASGAERRPIERNRGVEFDGEEGGRQQGSGRPELRGDETLFPPGPIDLEGWRLVLARSPELEPAFRRVADGLASRLDTARVDRLRMLGNGVVPLQAAYAVRTLATRLASRGSAGAARLVRMMEDSGA